MKYSCMLGGFVAFLLVLAGCGGPSVEVTGRVTCQGKAVAGAILFSPKGDTAKNKGPAVEVLLKSDGQYSATLTTVGMHRIVVKPSDNNDPSQEYPCDLAPIERELKAGKNEIVIELK